MKSKHLLLTLLLALFVPWAANAQSLCDPADMCEISYTLTDAYQDGWDAGAYLNVVDATTSTTLAQWHLNSGASSSGTLAVCNGRTINFVWVPATGSYVYNYECGFTVTAPNGEVIVSHTGSTSDYSAAPTEGIVATYTVVCPSCPKPTNLACTATTGTPATATFSWTNGGTETDWVLEYGTASDFTGATSVNISESDLNTDGSYTLTTGLTADNKYYARLKADCGDEESDWSNTVDFKPSNEVCDGIGTGTASATLVVTSYGCTYSQHIYTATELLDLGFTAGDIVSVSFYYTGTSSYKKTQSIYMGHTTKSAYSSSAVSEFESDVTLVYGPQEYTAVTGWHEYELTQPFEWDGTSNIVIGLLTNANNGTSSNWGARGTSTSPAYRSIYRYRDTTPIDITDLGSVGNGSWTINRPNINLCILPSATPKPLNLQVSNITSSGATVSWQAPASATPTSYSYRYYNDINWTSWESTSNLSVDLNLQSSTHYTFQVKAIYDGVGESDFIETSFTTLDDCAFPTSLMPYTVAGEGTTATLSWKPGYDETAWVLEYATNADFTEGLVEKTTGFVTQVIDEVTYIACPLTGLTAETHYYARVKADCDGSTSSWSNVAEFTPTNYVDFTVNENATSSTSYAPFYYYYVGDGYTSQFIIPAASLTQVAGGTVKRLTFYSTSSYANVNWGNAEFAVYVKEVENANFPTTPTSGQPLSFDDMTNVYSGSLSVIDNQMVIELDNSFEYNGGNLMIGFDVTTLGTENTVSWVAASANNAIAYSYYGYSYSTYSNTWTASRASYLPKVTFNYQPTPYKYPTIDEDHSTFGTTSAHIAWTVPFSANPTGYQYQYKLASAAEWPTTWTSVTAATAYADLSPLTPGSYYDFRVKALYEGNHESAVVDYDFWTQCAVVNAFPWKEDFEAYSAGDFSHPCWVNQHLSGDGSTIYIYKVVTETMGDNDTKILKLTDQTAGTETMLRLPEMILPSNDYQFVIDVYRNTNTYQSYPYELEGIHVYVSTNGNLEGATELAYIPRHKDVSNTLIPAEEETGWYTYEIPVGISGNCYIILKGVNQYCTSIYMDNFSVEQIPTCARPKDLDYDDVTNHSATLSWTAGDAEQTLWQIAYSKTSFDPNTASFDVTTVNTVDATANPYTFVGTLDAASTYYMYVRANCGTATEPDFGPWNRSGVSFTTLAATPAPSNFVASNPASEKVDMTWNAGGGDFESWELYYVASETAPEAPTATTQASVSDITTLPTTEHPYVLDGLNPVTKYYAWIRAKHVYNNEVTYSDWVALTDNCFETLDACPTPTDLAVSNITSVGADISWTGSDDVDDYTVQYRVSEQLSNPVLNEGFASFTNSNSQPITGWTKLTGLVDDAVNGTEPTSSNYGWRSTTHAFNNNNATLNIFGTSCKYWLVTPEITLSTGQTLNFDLALTDYNYSDEIEDPTDQADDRFAVVIYADNAWTILREWNDGTSQYGYSTISTTGENVTISLAAYDGKAVKIAFYGESTVSGGDNDLHIDNVVIGTPTAAGSWTDATTNETSQSYTLTVLEGDTKYDVHVKSNCTNGEYCEPVTFTTLADGTKVFTNATHDGMWGTAGNWAPTGAPAITDNVIIRANDTIASGVVAEAKKITFEGSSTLFLVIADGGQLKTDNSVAATVKKTFTGYGTGNEADADHYYLIANPFSSNSTPTYDGIITSPATTYDLYQWSRTANDGNEWRNYKKNTFSLSNGSGYLYANANTVTFSNNSTVKANNTAQSVYVYYTAPSGSNEFSDWNLLGNPFVCNAYLVSASENGTALPYYKMNGAGDGFEAVADGGAIAPMEGIFYQATANGYVYFTRTAPSAKSAKLNMNLSRNNKQLDNAILVFGGNQQMGKFSFRANSSKIYMPVEGKDFAIVSTESNIGEMPLSFEAEKNGSYTLSFTSEEVSFAYLHLIDNMTGIETDLLANPSYSFDARTTDYESRFKLVFATGNSSNDDNFAYYSNGNWVIANEGRATLQVVDVNGRILKSESINGCANVNFNAAAGVYVIRLVNGDNVKVQKVVVK